ncbi:MAG: sulfate adenylyltransferase subunit CysN [Gemmataceae bacterium]|jgi:bifunctional enzyme CysN/CysC|nr:sulfate adenylyltransferase subunit CysN [Planctomycetota bacterium]
MDQLHAKNIVEYLEEQRQKETLRFITCGSVDDGKSTLIGRLLYESKCIFDDQLKALESDSKRYGTQGEKIDFALLVDGLEAEREQGITIDVAYRFFATDRRRYIVADTPGHEQYTRNMATGASTAQLAILLIDARKGILPQTRRHHRIVTMMGIRHIVLAVNKMDLVGYDAAVFNRIEADYRVFAKDATLDTLQAIPLAAIHGDNVLKTSEAMPWYTGPTLFEHLDTVDVSHTAAREAFRLPVQWVNRPNLNYRGFCGRIAEGKVRPGDAVRVLPSGRTTTVRSIDFWEEQLSEAEAGASITLTLNDEVDVSRGDLIVAADAPPEVADQFQVRILWMAEEPMVPGRSYWMKVHAKEITATVMEIKHREDVNTGAHLAAKVLNLNEIAVATLVTSQPVVFEPYTTNRILGGFILIDRLTFATVGAGMVDFALRRASNIHWQALELGKLQRAMLKHQTPRCIWFTGLSGSGKSTVANMLEKRLHADGRHTYMLDGDNVRHGLNRDLGFSEADRVENLRRVGEVAKLMVDAGLIVLVSFISPFRADRQTARELFEPGEFIEVHVDTPLAECERRDVKGLYAKARRGELKNFTGIDSPYEPPVAAELVIDTSKDNPEACALQVLKLIEGR